MKVIELPEKVGDWTIYHVIDPDIKTPVRVQLPNGGKLLCSKCISRGCKHVEAATRAIKNSGTPT